MRHQIADLHSANPHRPPDWRFQLAEWLVAGEPPAPAHGWDDPAVDRAVQVLLGDVSDEAVLAAFRFRDGPAIDRAEIEARIVTDRPGAEIASEMALPAPVPAIFEALFFDVRGRVHSCPGLVLPDARLPLMPDDVWGLLMLAAIRPGPVPIGWLAWYFRTGLGGGLRLSQVPGLSPGERDCAKRVRDWVRSKTLSKNPLKVMKSLAAVRRREMLAEMRADWRQSDPPAPHLAVDCQQ